MFGWLCCKLCFYSYILCKLFKYEYNTKLYVQGTWSSIFASVRPLAAMFANMENTDINNGKLDL